MLIETMDKKPEVAASDSPSYPDAPPAYETLAVAGPSASPAEENTERGVGLALHKAPPNPAVAIDKIRIEQRNKDITGTYHLNPRPKKMFLGMSMNEDSEIRFRSRRGNIDLNLSTGYASNLSDKIDVRAGTRQGNVFINLTSLSPKSYTSLRARSRRGHVTVFLPQDYSGSVHLETNRGALHVLPGISSLARLEKVTDKKQVLNFGTVHSTGQWGDFCKLYSRQGTVTLGLHGVDTFVPPVRVEGGKDDDGSSDSNDSESV